MPLSPLLAEALSLVEAAGAEDAAGAEAAAASPAADGAEAPVAAEVPSDAALAAEGDEAVLAAAGAEAVDAADALLGELAFDALDAGVPPVEEAPSAVPLVLALALALSPLVLPGAAEEGAEDVVDVDEAVPGDAALDVDWLEDPGALDVPSVLLLVESPQPSPVVSLLVLPRSTPVLLLLCEDVEVEVEVVPC